MKWVALLGAGALIVVTAGCGQDRATVPPGAIAVVGDRSVPRSALDAQLAQSRRAYAARGQDFPKPGTDSYRRLQDNAVRLLVDRTLAKLYRSGAIASIFAKTFGKGKPSELLRATYSVNAFAE